MISINLFNLESFFKFSFLKRNRKVGIDQIFYVVGFKSLVVNESIIEEIKNHEKYFHDLGYDDYQIHFHSFVIGSHYSFISNEMMSMSNYLEVLKVMKQQYESEDYFAIEGISVYRGYETEKKAIEILKLRYLNSRKTNFSDADKVLLSQLSNKKFNQYYPVVIHTVKCEKGVMIGAVLTEDYTWE